MEDELPEIEEYCEECDNKTRMKFVRREDEYLIYECSICNTEHRFLKEKIEEEYEDEWEEWKEEWEE